MSVGMQGGGSKSSQKSYSLTQLPGYTTPVGTSFAEWLQSQFGPEGELVGAAPYTGRLTAGLTEGEQAVIDQLMGYYPMATKAFQQVAGISPEELESRWTSQYYEPAKKIWGEITEPAIREAYGGPGGYYSSERQEAQRKGAEDFATEMAASRAEYMTEAEQRGLDAVMQQAQYASTISDVAAREREVEQAALTAQYNEWLRTQPENSPYIQYILSLLNIQPETVSYGLGYSKAFSGGGSFSTGGAG